MKKCVQEQQVKQETGMLNQCTEIHKVGRKEILKKRKKKIKTGSTNNKANDT